MVEKLSIPFCCFSDQGRAVNIHSSIITLKYYIIFQTTFIKFNLQISFQ